MHLTKLVSAAYRRMPWKNGGGSTLELVQESAPDGGFNWRLSIADVAAPGPFSTFDGIDRHIMLMEGNGMVLSFADAAPPVVIAKPLQPHPFRGDWQTDCRLIDGAIRDFNVMVRRTWGRAAVNGFDFVAGQKLTLAVAPLSLIHLYSGTVDCASESLASGDTLRLEADGVETTSLAVTSPAARIVVVALKAHEGNP
jgi:environmental stress-induced protein Ves